MTRAERDRTRAAREVPRTDEPEARAPPRGWPGEPTRRGLLDVAYATVDTPLGTAAGGGDAAGPGPGRPPERGASTGSSPTSPPTSRRGCSSFPRRLDEARRELDQYFDGGAREFDLPLDWRLSRPGFYPRVLRATARVPYGEVITYAEVAARAGSPRGSRAAGNALGSNPIPIVVPCHRVIRTGGALGGLRRRPGDEALPARARGRRLRPGPGRGVRTHRTQTE